MSTLSVEQATGLLNYLLAQDRPAEVLRVAQQLDAQLPGQPDFALCAGHAYAKLGNQAAATACFLRALVVDPLDIYILRSTLVALSRSPVIDRNYLYEVWLSITLPDASEDEVIAYLAARLGTHPDRYEVFAPLSLMLVGFGRPKLAVEMFGYCLDDPEAPAMCSRDVQAKYHDVSVTYDDYPWHQEAVAQFTAFAGSILGDVAGLAIVDAGCGSGLAGPALRRWASRLTGIDLSDEMLHHAAARQVYDLLAQGDMVAVLRDMAGQADVVACLGTAYYLKELAPLLRATSAALKPNGLFLLQDFPAPDGQGVRQTAGGTHRFCRAADLIRQEAVAAGFHEEACRLDLAFSLPSYFWAFRKTV